jgi:hypothetical protein
MERLYNDGDGGYTELGMQIGGEVHLAVAKIFRQYPLCSVRELSHIAQTEIYDLEHTILLRLDDDSL